jgi:DNA polymerase
VQPDCSWRSARPRGGLLGAGGFKALGETAGVGRRSPAAGMVTYHPSYLLRNNSNRAKRVVLGRPPQVVERRSCLSEKQRNFFLER